jgi:ABC-type uncharacterized transport system substrate-binding protein
MQLQRIIKEASRDSAMPGAAGGDARGRPASFLSGRPPKRAAVRAGESSQFFTPIVTPALTLINNIRLHKHFFVDNPSGNITGFATLEATLAGKWLELLSEIAPGLKRVAIMFNPDTATVSANMPSFETAARSLKVVPITAPVHGDVEIETAITALGREPGGGLVVMPDIITFVRRAPIILAAARSNVPAVYWEPESSAAS